MSVFKREREERGDGKREVVGSYGTDQKVRLE